MESSLFVGKAQSKILLSSLIGLYCGLRGQLTWLFDLKGKTKTAMST
jgi:hypothetical protein